MKKILNFKKLIVTNLHKWNNIRYFPKVQKLDVLYLYKETYWFNTNTKQKLRNEEQTIFKETNSSIKSTNITVTKLFHELLKNPATSKEVTQNIDKKLKQNSYKTKARRDVIRHVTDFYKQILNLYS